MDRYKPFQPRSLISVESKQSITIGPGDASTPYRVSFDTTKQRDIVVSGIRVTVLEVQPYSVRYRLDDTQRQ